MEQNSNEWVIHVWGKKRESQELTDVEKFHIDMLKIYQEQQKRFDKILINIAMDDINDKKLFNFLKKEIGKAISNKNVEFKSCQNDSTKGEYVTFKPYVFDRIGENVNVFYSHFKGYRSYFLCRRESFPVRITDICEMFWSYIMYRYSLNFDDVQEKLNSGKNVYCWYILKSKIEDLNKSLDNYYIDYQECLQSGNENLKNYIENDEAKHSPGSFIWYNLKSIGESLKNKPDVVQITPEYLIENSKPGETNLCTHFCELYLMQFLKDEDCYSVNDFDEAWKSIRSTLYISLYPSKKIARDLLGEFEKYLIDKELI